jgi:hypothetical protein
VTPATPGSPSIREEGAGIRRRCDPSFPLSPRRATKSFRAPVPRGDSLRDLVWVRPSMRSRLARSRARPASSLGGGSRRAAWRAARRNLAPSGDDTGMSPSDRPNGQTIAAPSGTVVRRHGRGSEPTRQPMTCGSDSKNPAWFHILALGTHRETRSRRVVGTFPDWKSL